MMDCISGREIGLRFVVSDR